MNFAELRTMAAQLSALPGYENVLPAPNWSELVNQALREISWETEFFRTEATFNTVVNQMAYTLVPPYWKRIDQVQYGTSDVLEETTESQQRSIDELWQTAPSGKPNAWLWRNTNVIFLIPAPNAVVTVTIRGVREAFDLVNDSDTPGFVTSLHPIVAYRAARRRLEVPPTDPNLMEAWQRHTAFLLNSEQQMNVKLLEHVNTIRYRVIPRHRQHVIRTRTWF